MSKKGIVLPLILLIVFACVIAAIVYFQLGSKTNQLPKSVPNEENIESSLNEENEKYPDESYLEREYDSQIKIGIASIAVWLEDYNSTPGIGKYPPSLDIILEEERLRQLPLKPTAENYQYIVCLNSTESILFSPLKAENGYWTWTSFEKRVKPVDTMPTDQNCISKSL